MVQSAVPIWDLKKCLNGIGLAEFLFGINSL